LIEVNVRAHVGDFRLSAVLEGEGVICIAGRNGSGKSTLMRVMAGFLPLDEGYVKVGGADVTRFPAEKRGMVLVNPSSFIPHLKVDSHILWGARLKHGRPSPASLSKIKQELGIDFEGKVGSLSRGMRQRVALATALVASPRAILVDEAFLGLHEKEEFIVTYGKLVKEEGIDLLFSSQDQTDGRMSDHLFVIDAGSMGPGSPDKTRSLTEHRTTV